MYVPNPDATVAVIDGILQAKDPALSARYIPAEDESVDDDFEIYRAGEKTAISIQYGPYGIATNRHFYDDDGEINAMQDLYNGNNISTAAEKAAAAL